MDGEAGILEMNAVSKPVELNTRDTAVEMEGEWRAWEVEGKRGSPVGVGE